jgi:hypothetical protein
VVIRVEWEGRQLCGIDEWIERVWNKSEDFIGLQPAVLTITARNKTTSTYTATIPPPTNNFVSFPASGSLISSSQSQFNLAKLFNFFSVSFPNPHQTADELESHKKKFNHSARKVKRN